MLCCSNCQAMLPATGAPVSRQRASKMREMFNEYVRIRTLENWKFWIVSFASLELKFVRRQTLYSSLSPFRRIFLCSLTFTIVGPQVRHCVYKSPLQEPVLGLFIKVCIFTHVLQDPIWYEGSSESNMHLF